MAANPRAAMMAAAQREGRVTEVAAPAGLPSAPAAPRFPMPKPVITASFAGRRSGGPAIGFSVPLPTVLPQPVTPERVQGPDGPQNVAPRRQFMTEADANPDRLPRVASTRQAAAADARVQRLAMGEISARTVRSSSVSAPVTARSLCMDRENVAPTTASSNAKAVGVVASNPSDHNPSTGVSLPCIGFDRYSARPIAPGLHGAGSSEASTASEERETLPASRPWSAVDDGGSAAAPHAAISSHPGGRAALSESDDGDASTGGGGIVILDAAQSRLLFDGGDEDGGMRFAAPRTPPPRCSRAAVASSTPSPSSSSASSAVPTPGKYADVGANEPLDAAALDSGDGTIQVLEGAQQPRIRAWLLELRSDAFRKRLGLELSPQARAEHAHALMTPERVERRIGDETTTHSAATTTPVKSRRRSSISSRDLEGHSTGQKSTFSLDMANTSPRCHQQATQLPCGALPMATTVLSSSSGEQPADLDMTLTFVASDGSPDAAPQPAVQLPAGCVAGASDKHVSFSSSPARVVIVAGADQSRGATKSFDRDASSAPGAGSGGSSTSFNVTSSSGFTTTTTATTATGTTVSSFSTDFDPACRLDFSPARPSAAGLSEDASFMSPLAQHLSKPAPPAARLSGLVLLKLDADEEAARRNCEAAWMRKWAESMSAWLHRSKKLAAAAAKPKPKPVQRPPPSIITVDGSMDLGDDGAGGFPQFEEAFADRAPAPRYRCDWRFTAKAPTYAAAD